MLTKRLCVLTHIRTKGEVGTHARIQNVFFQKGSNFDIFFLKFMRGCFAGVPMMAQN